MPWLSARSEFDMPRLYCKRSRLHPSRRASPREGRAKRPLTKPATQRSSCSRRQQGGAAEPHTSINDASSISNDDGGEPDGSELSHRR